ncbi:MAG: isoprenyl transferase [Lachnospiraceae bacterium]|nr:isoprenyl transferase [Lachnospiraceae bacterium]
MAEKYDVVDLEGMKIPTHVAIILDGNGRWAKKRLMPRNMGHRAGAKTVEQIIEDAHNIGIKYLTVYAFSTENWNRPEEEVKELMKLLRNYLETCIKRANKNNMRVRVIGERSRLDSDIRQKIEELEEASEKNTGINFTIALNYGSRDEIRRAITNIAKDCKEGTINPDDIDDAMISNYLDTKDIPDPDLLIRTSGEQRLSNYLLWQLAYTEFYFTDVLWPDFNKSELIKAVIKYNGRDRRFGKVEE